MFELALKGKLPIIGVVTDDLLNLEAVLHSIAQTTVSSLPKNPGSQGAKVWWTEKTDQITPTLYKQLIKIEKQVVVVNLEKPHPLVFDAGLLPTPVAIITEYLSEITDAEHSLVVAEALKGLSLKSASEVVQLTMARTGGLNPKEIRRTRMMISGGVQGLHPVDTELGFYIMPKELQKYLKINDEYFLNQAIPYELVPRGVLLSGIPGVGKTMAARAIARYFNVQLFHMDIATTLNKYIGESEGRVARSLSLVERESPCVLLFDEVEKIFSGQDDSGVTNRILSQLLWWLSEHRSRIITVMTTNNIKTIPPELFRPGRLDKVIELQPMGLNEAKSFVSEVFKSVLKKDPTIKQQAILREAVEKLDTGSIPHVLAADLTYDLIKVQNWLI